LSGQLVPFNTVRPHRRPIDPHVRLTDSLCVSIQAGNVTEQRVTETVRLSGDAVRVIRNDRRSVAPGKLDQRGGRSIQLIGEAQHVVAQDGCPISRMHVLTRTAGVQQCHLRPGSLDEQWFEGDDCRGPLAARLITVCDHFRDTGCNTGRNRPVKQPFVGVDRRRRLVDLTEPEEFIARRRLRLGGGPDMNRDDSRCQYVSNAFHRTSPEGTVIRVMLLAPARMLNAFEIFGGLRRGASLR
jgi:hypothetical protein